MWIKRAEYIRLNREIVNKTERNERLIQLVNDWQKQYDKAKEDIERIKEKAFSRRQILAELSYRELVSMANNEYGIDSRHYDDKADLIDEILCVEKRLGAKESK